MCGNRRTEKRFGRHANAPRNRCRRRRSAASAPAMGLAPCRQRNEKKRKDAPAFAQTASEPSQTPQTPRTQRQAKTGKKTKRKGGSGQKRSKRPEATEKKGRCSGTSLVSRILFRGRDARDDDHSSRTMLAHRLKPSTRSRNRADPCGCLFDVAPRRDCPFHPVRRPTRLCCSNPRLAAERRYLLRCPAESGLSSRGLTPPTIARGTPAAGALLYLTGRRLSSARGA